MTDIREARRALVRRILEGAGRSSQSERRAAFNNRDIVETVGPLVEKVAMHANTVTDQDINVAKASGVGEDQLFEIVVCASIGQATRQYDAAIAALETSIGKE